MTLPPIDNDDCADFLAEAANASPAELEELVRNAIDAGGGPQAVAAAVLIASLCGFESGDADIEVVCAADHLRVDEDLRTGALAVLETVDGTDELQVVLR